MFLIFILFTLFSLELTDVQNYSQQEVQNLYYGEQQNGEECYPMNPEIISRIIPKNFTTSNGQKGWVISLPEELPIATPAFFGGKIFVGGGFGSYSFYAIDAKKGLVEWAVNTGDDGPTAAVVEDNIVVFNTESCIIYALDVNNGKDLWHHWLGDPLMSQPAIYDGRVFMAYPGEGQHMLICLDLYTGETYWKKSIVSDIISAPVVDKDEVYLASFDGMIYCYSCDDGEEKWRENYNATSAPWIYQGEIYTSMRENEVIKDSLGEEVEQRFEGIGVLSRNDGVQINPNLYNRERAEYLHAERTSQWAEEQMEFDQSVGFGSTPSTAQLDLAEGNVGVWSVSGAWAYQGSRPVYYDGSCFNAQGNTLFRLDPKDGDILWKWEYSTRSDHSRSLTPPSIAGDKIYIASNVGEIICINAQNGELLWKWDCGDPIIFQPSVMEGRVFWGTTNGKVYCIDTGDNSSTGWAMWGGNAAHNGWVED